MKTRYGWRSKLSSAFLANLMLLSSSVGVFAAAPSFQQALKDFKAGEYNKALSQFSLYKAAYPDNALTRYYMAICLQQLNQNREAEKEYNFVMNNGNEKLRGLAEVGLAQIRQMSASGGVKFTASPGAQSIASKAAASSPSLAALQDGAGQKGRIKKVLEFYTTWCHVCKEFAPTFDATKSHYSNLEFKQLDAEDAANKGLVKQYGIKSYPTLVFLDDHDNVLMNRPGAPQDEATFSGVIEHYSH